MSKTATKHIIWSSEINLDDWKDYIEDELMREYEEEGLIEAGTSVDDFIKSHENEVYEKVTALNNDYLGDERINLNVQTKGKLMVIADLGLWDGHHSGFKYIKTDNIADCLSSSCDSAEWYVDENGDLRCTASHHDGTNHYRYREVKPDLGDDEVDRFEEKLYYGKATESDIEACTIPIGTYIAKVYGW